MRILQLLFKNVKRNNFIKSTWKESQELTESIFSGSKKQNKVINRSLTDEYAEFLAKKTETRKYPAYWKMWKKWYYQCWKIHPPKRKIYFIVQ
jgi:hypothetical protein